MAAERARRMTPEELILAAAKAALEDASGDLNIATEMMVAAAGKSSALRNALLEPYLETACREAVRRQIQSIRREVWTASKGKRAGSSAPSAVVEQQQRARVVQLAAGTLMMFPLPGGKRLGEATREEVAAAAEFYAKQSADMGAKANWLRLIGQSLPEGKKVAEILTDRRLQELQAEAAKW